MPSWFDLRRNPVYRAERSEDRRGSRVLLAALGVLVPLWVVRCTAHRFEGVISQGS